MRLAESEKRNARPSTAGPVIGSAITKVCLDRDPGDISTIEDAGSVEEARAAWQQLRAEMLREG